MPTVVQDIMTGGVGVAADRDNRHEYKDRRRSVIDIEGREPVRIVYQADNARSCLGDGVGKPVTDIPY